MSKNTMQPSQPVQRQLEAYNAKDLAAFIACYHADVCIYRMPALEPVIIGQDALAHFYANKRFSNSKLRAEVLKRMVVGNKVLDHERVYGMTENPYEVVVVYEVQDSLILNAWFYPA